MNNELYSNNDYRYYSLAHHGILGQKWHVRRYQNEDGSLTSEGREHYGYGSSKKEKIKLPKEVEKDIARTIKEEREKYEHKNANAFEAAKLEKKINKALNGRKINYEAVQKLENARNLKIKDLSEEDIENGRIAMKMDSSAGKSGSIGAIIGAVSGASLASVVAGAVPVCPPAAIAVGGVAIASLWGSVMGSTIGSAIGIGKNVTKYGDVAKKAEEKFQKELTDKLTKKYSNDPRVKKEIEKNLNDAAEEERRRSSMRLQQEMIQRQNQIVQQQINQQIQNQINQQIQTEIQNQIDQQIQMEIQNQINQQIQDQMNQQMINQQMMMR